MISQTNRNGFHYTLDRTNGQFIKAEPFTEVNWTAGLDAKTGKPIDYDPTKTVQDYAGKAVRYGRKAIDVRPAHYGMPTLMPNTYDPSRGITYFQAMIGQGNYFNTRPADPAKGIPGAGFREIFCGSHTKDNGLEPVVRNVTNPNCKVSHGLLGGIDVRTGSLVKKLESYYPAYSGVLGTASGLLFMGDIMGKISAFDKDTMQELWSFEFGNAVRWQSDDLCGERQTVCRADARWSAGTGRRVFPRSGGGCSKCDAGSVRPLAGALRCGGCAPTATQREAGRSQEYRRLDPSRQSRFAIQNSGCPR